MGLSGGSNCFFCGALWATSKTGPHLVFSVARKQEERLQAERLKKDEDWDDMG